MKRCKKCLLPETYPKIEFNEKQICNFCLEEKEKNLDKKITKSELDERKKLRKDFESFLEKIKGKSKYDCLLLLSGGKDSVYLLYLLKEKYGLNVLALTVDTGLLNPRAVRNIKKTMDHFKVDHIFYKPENGFFKRLYKYFLLNPNDITYCDTICAICQKVVLSAGLNVASEKKIPFVALGYSPDQALFYEYPEERISKGWVPKELFNKPFTEKDRSYFWDPKKVKKEEVPRLLLPYYVLDYPSVKDIMKQLSDLDLGAKLRFHPVNTSCYLAWFMIHLDLRKHGYNPYVKDAADLIRLGKIKRGQWFLIVTVGTWLLKMGIARRKVIKHVIRHLNLDMKKLYCK